MAPSPVVASQPGTDADRVRAAAWREAVLELRYGERRRLFPTTVHVGRPGGARAAHVLPLHPGPAGQRWDHALRADLVGALLDRCTGPDQSEDRGGPLCWVSRPGTLEGHDDDLAWLSAATTAYTEAGLPPRLAVVTHVGWYEPATGAGRTWKRLRRVPARGSAG